jgi:hypothetical protein
VSKIAVIPEANANAAREPVEDQTGRQSDPGEKEWRDQRSGMHCHEEDGDHPIDIIPTQPICGKRGPDRLVL